MQLAVFMQGVQKVLHPINLLDTSWQSVFYHKTKHI